MLILAADETNASLPFTLSHFHFGKVPVHPYGVYYFSLKERLSTPFHGYQRFLHWSARRLQTDVTLHYWTCHSLEEGLRFRTFSTVVRLTAQRPYPPIRYLPASPGKECSMIFPPTFMMLFLDCDPSSYNVYPTPDLPLPSSLRSSPNPYDQLGSEASTPHPNLLPKSKHQHHTTPKTRNVPPTLWHRRRTSAAS